MSLRPQSLLLQTCFMVRLPCGTVLWAFWTAAYLPFASWAAAYLPFAFWVAALVSGACHCCYCEGRGVFAEETVVLTCCVCRAYLSRGVLCVVYLLWVPHTIVMYLLGVPQTIAVCLLGMPRPFFCVFVEGATSYSNIGFNCWEVPCCSASS